MNNHPAITELRRAAFHALAALRGLPADPLLRAVLGGFHQRQARECLAALDRDAVALPCREGREAARRAAKEVRSDQAGTGRSAPAR